MCLYHFNDLGHISSKLNQLLIKILSKKESFIFINKNNVNII